MIRNGRLSHQGRWKAPLCHELQGATSQVLSVSCHVCCPNEIKIKDAFNPRGTARRLSLETVHALGVVLEINKAVTVVQCHLKPPEHGETEKTGDLRPG